MGAYYDIYPYSGANPNASISTATYGTAPNRVFVVSFNQNPMFSCTSTSITQQIVLHEGTNQIDINIENKASCSWNGDLAIEGIQNGNGTIGYAVPGRNCSVWTATNDSWSFVPQGGTGGSGVNPTSITWSTTKFGPSIGTGDTIQVCPNATTQYFAKATYDLCGLVVEVYDSVTITKELPITFKINSITDALCYQSADGAIDFTCSGGSGSYNYTINGNPSSNNPTGLTANTYVIIATDASNCTASTTITINQPTDIVTSSIVVDIPCKYQQNGKVYLTTTGGLPPYQYWHNNTSKTTADSFIYMAYGNHKFYTSDIHNCVDSIDVFVNQPDSLLSIELVPKLATCLAKNDGEVEAIASGGVSPYYYNWNTFPVQLTTALITNLASGVYNGTVIDANGCVASHQAKVEQQLCCELFLPNAFTPNNDGKNDYFHMTQRGGGIKLGEMKIFNRWGQEIYTSRNVEDKGWDGTFKGVPQNSDTYFYVIVYNCNDKGENSQKIAKGDIILIR
jgi:gliding motility-associated-like protein